MKLTQLTRHLTLIAGLGALAFFSGCLSPKMYVDPKFRSATEKDIIAPAVPVPVQLTVKGQSNGKENKRAGEFWTKTVTNVLSKTRVFAAAASASNSTLDITINNIGDMGSAAGKGFATGLTFGLAGTTVTDGYIMTAVYRDSTGKSVSKEYKHAIHTTIGNTNPPLEGVQPLPPSEASVKVAEDMILNFLLDLQKESVIATGK